MGKPTIIAEFGINHKKSDGSFIENIPEFIAKLATSGADMIKFQHFYADELVREDMPSAYSLSSGKPVFQRDLTRKWETPLGKQEWLKDMCQKNNVEYLCTPVGVRALDDLLKIGQTTIKIASCDCGNIQFLQDIINRQDKIKRIILSTGISSFSEVNESVGILREGSFQLSILHCTSSYPTDPEHANLEIIKVYKRIYGNAVIGFSDHTLGTQAAVVARTLGAEVFEKHVTPDINMDGPDHKASFPIDNFKEYVDAILDVDTLLGINTKIITKTEKKPREWMKKGIWINKDIPMNSELTRDSLAVCRPCVGTTPAVLYNTIVGKKLKVDKKKNDPVLETDVWQG